MDHWRIPLSDLDYGAEEYAAVRRVLESKWLTMGSEVAAFEREFATLHHAKHALAVANGTAGLHLGFLALGVGPGDEVIQPALNFVAAANMTIACGATPVFADIISAEEPTIDPGHVARLITSRTKAIVVMHYGGNFCRMADLLSLCEPQHIALMEDASHAVGAQFLDARGLPPHGKMAGTIGDVSAFSFFSNKNLATGEGGMILTNSDAIAGRVRLLRSHGMTTLTWERHKGHARSYEVAVNGYNYRLDELRAALGRAQLAKLKYNNERRRHLLDIYLERLKAAAGWTVPFTERAAGSSCHLMVALAPTPVVKENVHQQLRETGIQTSLHYPCIADFIAFAPWNTTDVRLCRDFASRAITLPLFPTLTEQEVDLISNTLVSACC